MRPGIGGIPFTPVPELGEGAARRAGPASLGKGPDWRPTLPSDNPFEGMVGALTLRTMAAERARRGLSSSIDEIGQKSQEELRLRAIAEAKGKGPPKGKGKGKGCVNCGEPGHFIGECPLPLEKDCYNCGKRGHIADHCPEEKGFL